MHRLWREKPEESMSYLLASFGRCGVCVDVGACLCVTGDLVGTVIIASVTNAGLLTWQWLLSELNGQVCLQELICWFVGKKLYYGLQINKLITQWVVVMVLTGSLLHVGTICILCSCALPQPSLHPLPCPQCFTLQINSFLVLLFLYLCPLTWPSSVFSWVVRSVCQFLFFLLNPFI